jgi:hypothetical protein
MKVANRVALIVLDKVINLADHAIDGLVSELLRIETATATEKDHKSLPHFLVGLASLLSLRVQPDKKAI